MKKIAVIGLGYVGLPLALNFARAGAKVIGLDIDQEKVKALNAGQSYIKHISEGDVAEAVAKGALGLQLIFRWSRARQLMQ